MGKSKSRILHKGINDQIQKISRQDAIKSTVEELKYCNSTKAHKLITMFGLDAEELLEAGASYEAVVALKNIFKRV